MPEIEPTNSPIITSYLERTPASRRLAEQARTVFPSGIVHDSRHMGPYPVYVERASGARKWDVDGNEYIDFYGGHGSLLLGHAHPAMTEAVAKQATLGTHPAACHELELEWGTLVQKLVPSAERVRFTSSGTEANLMAIRLARAATGKNKLVRFRGHFHGWQDHVAFGVQSHFDGTPTPGVLDGIAENVIIAPPDDIARTEEILTGDNDIAAVILEPTGASSGKIPLSREFVEKLRDITTNAGIILIFDEVVTGFRLSPGGLQSLWGIRPDMTALAKILAGGLPGGAITGRRDILDHLDFEAAEKQGFEKIGHQGTFNANPLSAAAGVAMLERVAETDACECAASAGEALRRGWNSVFSDMGIPWAAYGMKSNTYLFTNPDGLEINPLAFDPADHPMHIFTKSSGHSATDKLRIALMLNGVDLSGKMGALTSAAHTEGDINDSVQAMRDALIMVQAEGDL